MLGGVDNAVVGGFTMGRTRCTGRVPRLVTSAKPVAASLRVMRWGSGIFRREASH